MKQIALILCLSLGAALVAGTVQAQSQSASQGPCTVEYKAKQDDPLRLSVGTIQVSQCAPAAAEAEARAQLAAQGWTLLKVLSIKG